jgi:AcrR family transcriptional regulator
MPPKTRYTKKDVINAAFEIVSSDGIGGLTARKVAELLGSSTAPVYSCFKTMNQLEREVVRKAEKLIFKYSTTAYTDRVFLNMGVGYAVFARDHRRLFRAIFLERSDYRDIVHEFLDSLGKELVKDPRFTKMRRKDREALLEKMWIFTHGLATLICVGLFDNMSNTKIERTLDNMGAVVIGAALSGKQGKSKTKKGKGKS